MSASIKKQQYLPNYLLGDSDSPGIIQSSPLLDFNVSNKSDEYSKSILKPTSKPNQTIKFAPQTFPIKNPQISHRGVLIAKDSTRNRPPVVELVTQPRYTTIPEVSYDTQPFLNLSDTINFDRPHQKSFNNTTCIQNQHISIFSDQLYWVRVFGIPPLQMKSILSVFSEYGVIISYKFASEGGNWMDIQYETKIEAMQALRKNGNIFLNNIMVGILPTPSLENCIQNELSHNNLDRSIIYNSKRNKAKIALQQSLAARELECDQYYSLIHFLNYIPGLSLLAKVLNYFLW